MSVLDVLLQKKATRSNLVLAKLLVYRRNTIRPATRGAYAAYAADVDSQSLSAFLDQTQEQLLGRMETSLPRPAG